jgi:murein DD-endopeptidase MepM/ murein hydrolase activator NlpD
MIQDYRKMKKQMPQLVRLAEDYEQQQRQFAYLTQRIDKVSQRVCNLKEFDRKLKVMVNLETCEDNLQFQGVGGSTPSLSESKEDMVRGHGELVRAMHNSLDDIDKQITLGEKDKAELYEFLENQRLLLASTPSIWPTKGWMSSRFGYRTSPFTGEREFHKGIDVSTRINAPIIAPADGIVSSITWENGYGRMLTIKHGHGLVTRYGHLEKALVKKGQSVKRGETIALVGNTGRSTGPHLHYEVHLNRVAVNPLRYILN